jgi:proteic killer suppression protein
MAVYLYEIQWSSLPPSIAQRAFDKLRLLHAASNLDDLRVPPSNRLEKLKRDRRGQWSIRINDQWRICFNFEAGNAHNVEVVDYH